MKNTSLRGLLTVAVSLSSLSAFATVYTDSVNDVAVGTFPHIDISSVTVTNTATDVTFLIALNGDPVATNWGKYNVILRSGAAGDTSDHGNGWGRPYNLSGGADHFIGGWVDQATNNSQLWSFGGGSWSQDSTFTSTITTSSVSYTVSLASIGASAGGSFVFDVVTTGGGGGDSAVDALSNPSAQITDWGQQTTVAGRTYAVAPVPEPASMAALSLGVAAMLRRRRR